MKAFKINVEGMVQGVGFRYFTQIKARELGVYGSVKNLSNGEVEIFVQGNESLVNDFLKWCHDGPPSSRVKGLKYSPMQVINDINSFVIIRI